VGEPTSPEDLERLQRMIGAGAEQLLGFYARHDGFVLYRDTHSLNFGPASIQAAGLELYRVAEMENHTPIVRDSFDDFVGEDDVNELKSAVAIGESPHSGNYFVFTTKGPKSGSIFFLDHDDWQDDPFAESFDEFLAMICTSPAELLSKKLGCTARYSDGQTTTQWIPREYVPDVERK